MVTRIISVIAGYAIFVVSSIAIFKVSGQKPHAPAAVGFVILVALCGGTFSVLSGFVLQLIAKANSLTLNFVLAIIIAGFATFSLIKADGSHWTQLLAIFVFAPTSILGGFFQIKEECRNEILLLFQLQPD